MTNTAPDGGNGENGRSGVCTERVVLGTPSEAASSQVARERANFAQRRLVMRARRLGVWVALGVASVTLLYLVGMNVFLRTRLFRSAITSDSGSLRIEYATAYSIVPGRIHVEGLAIRGRDGGIEWILTIDRCDFRQSFLDLLQRRFHASHVRGDGVAMRLRPRAPQLAPALAANPPVPGFLDPPLADAGPPPPPVSDADYRLFSIQLDDVVAEHVRELWIGAVRMTGDVRIEGRWLFRPLRWLEVGPAAIDVRSVNVSYGDRAPLGLDVHGTVVATIQPVAIPDGDASAIPDHVACDADLRGALLAAGILDSVGDPASKALASAWSIGPAAAHVTADHAASTVTFDVPELEFTRQQPISELLPLPEQFGLDAKGATGAVHVVAEIPSRSAKGHGRLVAHGLTIRSGADTMTGTLGVDIDGRAEASFFDFSGTTATFTTGAQGRAKAPNDWWIRVRAPEARIDTGEESRLHARLSASAKDASPVSAYLAKVTPLPRALVDAVPTENLRITAELNARPSVFEVRSLEAHAEGTNIGFEFEKLVRWEEWALLLQVGPLQAGMRSGDGGTEVVLTNVQPWFRAQVAAFRTNASRVR